MPRGLLRQGPRQEVQAAAVEHRDQRVVSDAGRRPGRVGADERADLLGRQQLGREAFAPCLLAPEDPRGHDPIECEIVNSP
jgi:hypothetical protein